MNRLSLHIENCYGIQNLQETIDFSDSSAVAIYAPNGSMKTSLAKIFEDVATDKVSRDHIFTTRIPKRQITDENGIEIAKSNILVFRSLTEWKEIPKTASILFVNERLRTKVAELSKSFSSSADAFFKVIKEKSGSKRDIKTELVETFATKSGDLPAALQAIESGLLKYQERGFALLPYDKIFDAKVIEFFSNTTVSTKIHDYITQLSTLLEKSVFFKKNIFMPYNATQVVKSLSDNRFFDANHKIILNNMSTHPVETLHELEVLINNERESIIQDKELRKKFTEIEKLLHKNTQMREFEVFLQNNQELLPHFENIPQFKQQILLSYIHENMFIFQNLLTAWHQLNSAQAEIHKQATHERTQWEQVVQIFNNRFAVPFKIEIVNKVDMILGKQSVPSAKFHYTDGVEETPIEKGTLDQVLSTGELRAMYIMNIIFEVEARKKANQPTLLIVDDIADSFDYKNKYAIIHYLSDIAELDLFKMLILTHNFDFFRAVQSRFIKYASCHIAQKLDTKTSFMKATGIKNIFVHDWKKHYLENPRAKIASIAFVRNLIEYTRGTNRDYQKLTALLHWKKTTEKITVRQLDNLYKRVFAKTEKVPHINTKVIDLIEQEAQACLKESDEIDLASKIVLSIAIRLCAERYMLSKLNSNIDKNKPNQTQYFLKMYRKTVNPDDASLEILERVVLMTPEHIHLNSFMYEPIIDMSSTHLKQLYRDMTNLYKQPQQSNMFDNGVTND